MALLFMDSFDHYLTAQLAAKYSAFNGVIIGAATGRRSSGSLRNDNISKYAYLPINASGTTTPIIVGYAFKISDFSYTAHSHIVIQLGTGSSNAQLSLAITGAGYIVVGRGQSSGSPLTAVWTATTNPIAVGVYSYIELKAVIHPSAGSVIVRVNGVEVINVTGQNTAQLGTQGWNGVKLGAGVSSGGAGFWDYDDLYVCDGTGVAPWNNFLGDIRVDALRPTGVGATTGWTPSTGANWQNVDDATPNDDTDYNSTLTVNAIDTFVVADSPVAGAIIYGVQHNVYTKKMDAGPALIAPVIRHSGVDYVGTDKAPGTTYTDSIQLHQVNPGTSAQWTEADFNAAEFGYKRTG